ncbi:DNA gyrase subunit A, partial [Phascolarctobacterium sp.]
MQKSYIDYAMSVIVQRALPDVRDGLKPVHRRILYAMQEAGMASNKPYKKSARIVGEVLGKYHPHGDSSVYDAIVRLAQDFSTRYLMVDGHGNFGSVDGDSAAAMRYTEVRMAKVAEVMLEDIEKETVDFVPNYDESLKEPSVLPAKVPALLINGSAGIAVGMATNIPPHNLGEVVDGLIMLIDNSDVEIPELMTAIKGPDFPTGAMILGTEGIRSAYTTGRGIVKIRAQAEIEPMQKGKHSIDVTEIANQVNKAQLIESIAKLVKAGMIEGITDLRDESDRRGMRIVVELRNDVVPDVILNQLYKHNKLQYSFGIIMLAL